MFSLLIMIFVYAFYTSLIIGTLTLLAFSAYFSYQNQFQFSSNESIQTTNDKITKILVLLKHYKNQIDLYYYTYLLNKNSNKNIDFFGHNFC